MNRPLKAIVPLTVAAFLSAVAASQTTQPATQKADNPATPPEIIVSLIDPGASPRQKLRFHPKAGMESTLNMTMNMSMSQTFGNMPLPKQTLPGTNVSIVMNVTDINDAGDISYDVIYADATMVEDENGDASPMSAMIQQTLDAMTGMKGKIIITNRGIPKSIVMDTPPGMNPMVKQQVENMKDTLGQMNMPFPKEEVGEGAKWNAVSTMNSGGITLTQTILSTLEKVAGDKLVISMNISQNADPQDINAPGAPPMKLTSMKTTGQGTTKLSLDNLAPISADMSMETNAVMTVTVGQDEQEMTQQMSIETAMKGTELRHASAETE